MDTTEISLVCPVGTCVTVISTTPGDEDLEGEAFVLAATAFLIRQAALYGCLPVTIRQHYTSEIAAIGADCFELGGQESIIRAVALPTQETGSLLTFGR